MSKKGTLAAAKLATTIGIMDAIIGQGPYKYDIEEKHEKEKVESNYKPKFIVKVNKQYIGNNGLVDKRENAFRYTSYGIAQEDSVIYSGKVKIIKL